MSPSGYFNSIQTPAHLPVGVQYKDLIHSFYPRPFSLLLCPYHCLLETFLSQTNCCLPDYKTLSNPLSFEQEEFSGRSEIQFWYTNNIENQEYLDYAIIEAQNFAHTSSCYSLHIQIIKKSSIKCSVQKKPMKIMRAYRGNHRKNGWGPLRPLLQPRGDWQKTSSQSTISWGNRRDRHCSLCGDWFW